MPNSHATATASLTYVKIQADRGFGIRNFRGISVGTGLKVRDRFHRFVGAGVGGSFRQLRHRREGSEKLILRQ